MFLFRGAAPTMLYPLSLHDALPISPERAAPLLLQLIWPIELVAAPLAWATLWLGERVGSVVTKKHTDPPPAVTERSEEHTSELQSQSNLVCRLLLEKKNKLHKT